MRRAQSPERLGRRAEAAWDVLLAVAIGIALAAALVEFWT